MYENDGSDYPTFSDMHSVMTTFGEYLASRIMEKVEDRLKEALPRPMEGTIMKGTWVPGSGSNEITDGTAVVLVNKTAAMPTDQGDGPVMVRMRITAPYPGHQFGPDGDERVHIHMTESGPAAQPYGGPQNLPGPPVGELWVGNKKRIRMYTVSGFQAVLDDTAKTLTLSSPGGLKVILDDNAGEVMIGKAGLSSTDSVMTQQDSQQLANAIISSVQTAFATFAAHVASGNGTTPPTVGSVTATGSSKVESQE